MKTHLAIGVVLLDLLVCVPCHAEQAHRLILADGRIVTVDKVTLAPEGILARLHDREEFYTWTDLEPYTAYHHLGRQLGKGPEAHLKLAEHCIGRGLVREAFSELDRAQALLPEAKARIDKLRKQYETSVRSGARVIIGPDLHADDKPLEEVLAEQRTRGEVTGKLLGVTVATLESKHFIIHTTFDEADRDSLTALAERLHQRFSRTFAVKSSKEFAWTGKVVIYAFARREQFTDFSERAHSFRGTAAGAYFRAAGKQAELVVPRNGTREHFEQDLTHEATHLFLHFYRRTGRIPNWLHEGLAQSVEFKAFPKCPARTDAVTRISQDLSRKGLMKLRDLIDQDRPTAASDLVGYAYAWSFVDYLLEKRRTQLIRFIRELKDGTDLDKAAGKAFGVGLTELEPSWIAHVRKTN